GLLRRLRAGGVRAGATRPRPGAGALTMRALNWLRLVALLARSGSYYTSSRFGVFGWVNAAAGGAALIAALVLWLRRARGLGSPGAGRPPLPRRRAGVAGAAGGRRP